MNSVFCCPVLVSSRYGTSVVMGSVDQNVPICKSVDTVNMYLVDTFTKKNKRYFASQHFYIHPDRSSLTVNLQQ